MNSVVSLDKGEAVSLTKMVSNLTDVTIGLGWKSRESAGDDFDLDASAFALGASGHVPGPAWFVFYNNLESTDGAVLHHGDNLVGGDGDNDDEQITLKLDKLPDNIARVAFVVTIYQASQRRQNFGQVSKAYMRIVDANSNNELARYNLREDFSLETAVLFGEVYREGGGWAFAAKAEGEAGGLGTFCDKYGITTKG